MQFDLGPFRGYGVLVITYVVGAFAFQLARWRRHSKRRAPLPVITQVQVWDAASTAIWPDVGAASWPPPKHLDGRAIEDFRERFKTVHF